MTPSRRSRLRAATCALSTALFGLAEDAEAQLEHFERVRVQGGLIGETRGPDTPRIDNFHIGIIPEVTLVWPASRSAELSLNYAFTGTLHSEYPNQIANQLDLNGAFDLGSRTRLVLTAAGAHTSLNAFVLTRPANQTGTGLLPTSSTVIVTGSVGEGLIHDISQDVRVDQRAGVTVFTNLPPAPPLDSLFSTFSTGIEKTWRVDGLGVEAAVGHSVVKTTPPAIDQNLLTVEGAPRWRHDWSQRLSTLVTAGAGWLATIDRKTSPLIYPFGRAEAIYAIGETTIDLGLSTGITPNTLTGQLFRAHQGTVRAVTPISARDHVVFAGSVGYTRGALIDRVLNADVDFDAGTLDAEVIWSPTPILQVFGRYTFLGQLTGTPPPAATGITGISPSFLRDSFLVGVAIRSRPPEIAGRRALPNTGAPEVSTRLPQRVDRADDRRDERDPNASPDAERREVPPAGVEGSRWTPAPNRPSRSDDDDD